MELESDHHEVLWVALSPRCLPREYSNIIIAVIYHPPDANCETMKSRSPKSLTNQNKVHYKLIMIVFPPGLETISFNSTPLNVMK